MWQQRLGAVVALVAGVFLLLVLVVGSQEEAPPPARPTPTRPPAVTATLTIDELIPPEIRFSTRFVEQLRAAGIDVQQVQPSLYGALFPDAIQAAQVKTSQGIADVIFLPPKSAPVQVTQRAATPPRRYQYSFAGQPMVSDTLDSNAPLYFVSRPAMLLITHSPELHTTAQRVLSP